MSEHEGAPEVEHRVPPEEEPEWPWMFLMLVGAGSIYLIWRFVELGIELFSG